MPQVSQKRLDDLLAKERAHDDYLTAAQEVRQRHASIMRSSVSDDFKRGYGRCIEDWARAVVAAANKRAARG